MEKMKMESIDIMGNNVEKIGMLFPNCITEALDEENSTPEKKIYKKAIDFEMLRQMLSKDVLEGDEAYEFSWVGKKAAIVEANKAIRKTLRPCPEESVDWDNTENVYIEGDNLEALKLLQESYLGKVKIMYIDPPYNTGNDFIYRDDFTQSIDEYDEESGIYDDSGNKLFKNTDSNGRFHSDWCSMIYSRLLLARNLLSDDGVIFISIGQAEEYNLTKICNEIFGEQNQVGIISRMMKSGGNKGQYFSPNMEYVLVYAKEITCLGFFREPLSDDIKKTYNHEETEGERTGEMFTIKGLCQPGLGIRPNQRYWIEAPDGSFLIPRGKNFPASIVEGEKILPTDEDTCWKWTYDRYAEEKKKGNIYFHKSTSATALVNENGETAQWNVFNKIWLSDRESEGRVPVDLITKWENRISSKELKDLGIPFDFAKPTELIKYLVSLVQKNKNAIVMDFFSGSATSADAVMQLNAEDGGKRKFIMIQLPEENDELSDAYKSGYKTICDIGKERIRRAGGRLETEHDIDTGFRVFKVDDTNMKDVYYSANEYNQSVLDLLESNIKEDRTSLDLLFGCIIEWGLPLDMKYKAIQKEGCTIHVCDDGDLVACFDNNIPDSVIDEISKMQPLRAVFRDSGFTNSPQKINLEERIKHIAPYTSVKVI
ncbi:site-specific DNA-methyltransferase [Butyrivibrio sp. LC3010]|uniref:site-specific DNA-methyltransferase n=1 Tax=Butyrivibrio sp. LC3010 TaxID=1280680 RepID=UPI0003FE43FE|nr:site-specific DNA-methyltransferase [Butyrivibrio sp. LC3010]